MRIRGVASLRRAARRLRKRFASEAVILLYHRVCEVSADPQSLCVHPARFAQHLEYLTRHHRVLRLSELAGALRTGGVPGRAVVITFDDGYADSLHVARPLLERYGLPATVFVTTGVVGTAREFWWDELERLLLQPGTLPNSLHLSLNGTGHDWELGNDARYDADVDGRYRDWSLLETHDPTERQRLYRDLSQRVRSLPLSERQRVMEELREWAGAQLVGRPTHRALSQEEIHALCTGELVEVGAHTMNHPLLSTLSVADQQAEIEGSKSRLEDIVEHPVTAFAYPYGNRSDYTSETAAIVREAGFACACSNFADAVWRFSDPYQLPRVLVRDWSQEEFASRIREWLRD